MSSKPMVTITQELYAELLIAQDAMKRLRAVGIDRQGEYWQAMDSTGDDADGDTHDEFKRKIQLMATFGRLHK